MKYNYQEDLNKKVPDEIRLSVYKDAIKIIEKGEIVFGLSEFYLCLMLPCILYDLNHYMGKRHNGNDWHLHDVQIAFPEIAPYIADIVKSIDGNKLRLKALNEIVDNFVVG